MRQNKKVFEEAIEQIMKTQMAMAGPMKIETSYDGGTILGCQTLAGWKRRRVCLELFLPFLFTVLFNG